MSVDWSTNTQIQGSDQLAEIGELGSDLSVEISCPVHYPAYNKHLFECMCGVVFPVYIVKRRDWSIIREKHVVEREYIK